MRERREQNNNNNPSRPPTITSSLYYHYIYTEKLTLRFLNLTHCVILKSFRVTQFEALYVITM